MKAISMSVQQILRSKQIIVAVPDTRKARGKGVPGREDQPHDAGVDSEEPPKCNDLSRYGLRGAPKSGSFHHHAIVWRPLL